MASRILLIVLLLAAPALADDPDALMRALREELARSSQLQLPGQPKPYFIQYLLRDTTSWSFQATDGALVVSSSNRARRLSVDVRVGSYDDEGTARGPVGSADVVLDDDVLGVRRDLWLATDAAWRRALVGFAMQKNAPKDPQKLPAFSSAPAITRVDPVRTLEVDRKRWEDMVRRFSAMGRDSPGILSTRADVSFRLNTRYLVNTEGTTVRDSSVFATVSYQASCETPEKVPVQETFSYVVTDLANLPSEEQMARDVAAWNKLVVSWAKAPTLSDDYLGPVLFVGTAAASTVGDVLIPVLSGRSGSEKLRKSILPVAISVKDDPAMRTYGPTPVLGTYAVDDEGVAAQPVSLIDRGILTGMLTGRKPLKGVKASNGHTRSNVLGYSGVFPSNLVVSTTDPRPFEELKALLLQRCREQGLAYGLIVRPDPPPSAAFTSGAVSFYRVSVATGKEEMVRNARGERLDLRGLRRLLALGNDTAVCNHAGGYTVICPSLLLSELEVTTSPPARGEAVVIPPPPR